MSNVNKYELCSNIYTLPSVQDYDFKTYIEIKKILILQLLSVARNAVVPLADCSVKRALKREGVSL